MDENNEPTYLSDGGIEDARIEASYFDEAQGMVDLKFEEFQESWY